MCLLLTLIGYLLITLRANEKPVLREQRTKYFRTTRRNLKTVKARVRNERWVACGGEGGVWERRERVGRWVVYGGGGERGVVLLLAQNFIESFLNIALKHKLFKL